MTPMWWFDPLHFSFCFHISFIFSIPSTILITCKEARRYVLRKRSRIIGILKAQHQNNGMICENVSSSIMAWQQKQYIPMHCISLYLIRITIKICKKILIFSSDLSVSSGLQILDKYMYVEQILGSLHYSEFLELSTSVNFFAAFLFLIFVATKKFSVSWSNSKNS